MEYDRQHSLSLWIIFCPFTPRPPLPSPPPIWTQKIKILKNGKNTGFSDMESNRQKFLSFWTIFCPFTPITTQKTQNFEKILKTLEISSFYTSATKIMIICYTVPQIWHVTYVIISHFGPFFVLLQPEK